MNPKNIDITKIKELVQSIPEISATYLFGSAVEGCLVVNDLDLLILTYPDINQDKAYFDIKSCIAQGLLLPEEYIDLLFLDINVTDPKILYLAITNGILLINKEPDLLSSKIEQLSLFFLINESYISRGKHLLKEQLEEFCVNQQRTSTSVSGPDQA